MSRRVAALLVLVAGGLLLGQDPGVDPEHASRARPPPRTTLQPCPDGGPDATTPPAGCLDADGNVVRPDRHGMQEHGFSFEVDATPMEVWKALHPRLPTMPAG